VIIYVGGIGGSVAASLRNFPSRLCRSADNSIVVKVGGPKPGLTRSDVKMAKFLALIYGDEQRWAEASPQWHQENGDRHDAFHVAAGAAIIGGDELESSAKAITVRLDAQGRPSTTDGPFLETKEVIGGYYLLEAVDLDEAIRLARQIPEASTPFSGVEIRPVMQSG
jgi:hypothetical protein